MTVKYDTTPEKIFLADVDAPARARFKQSCASSHAKWLWLRMELCATLRTTPKAAREKVADSSDVVAICRAFAAQYMNLQEFFGVLCLDSANKPVGFAVVSLGGVASAPVDLRIVFKPVLLSTAAAFIVTHNHPSGNPLPSPEDVALTQRISKAAAFIGLRCLDHIIVTEDASYSFLEAGLMT
jgi:DNA repair protein RadC